MLLSTFEAFKAHAHSEGQREACGLIVGEEYIPCRNVAPDMDDFEIHAEDWDAAEDRGTIRAVCHSHPGRSRRETEADLKGCKALGIPWFILGDDGLQRIDPEPIPLVGRVFDYGWSDCYSIVRDYLGDLPDFPREPEFWRAGHSPYEEQFEGLGFRRLDPTEALPGDVLLMRVLSPVVPNHAAIYLGAGWILHHLWGRMSCRELWGPWMSATTHVLRRDR
ncbi:C40 family peptidase [Mesoterricola sediminis]|uniref:Proteasome lid subunit RPN8/RPN11 n=1 Tax=Mesoterricola sediminis TaxID=2927980 RepID=A0AA48HDL1_9BACT|nr:C40 family peptidase [Mesoterricola sediminis]BDU76308.1 hypothetical protein METESE_12660 [Mesoterricola sediminis]